MRRTLATLVAFALSVVGLTGAQVAAAPQAEAAGLAGITATGGGKYASQITWLDWGATKNSSGVVIGNSGTRPAMEDGAYTEVELMPGFLVRATLSKIKGAKYSTNPTTSSLGTPSTTNLVNSPLVARDQDPTWADIRGLGYNTGSEKAVLAPSANGQRTAFTVDYTVYRNGVATNDTVDAIAADGENLTAAEWISFTAHGAEGKPAPAWQIIDNANRVGSSSTYRGMWQTRSGPNPPNGTPMVNGGVGTNRFGYLTSAGYAMPIAMAKGTSAIDVQIDAGGSEQVMLGFILAADWGDAPVSYGSAAHVAKSAAAGNWNAVASAAGPGNSPYLRLDTASDPYLGTVAPDGEGTPDASKPWTADDVTGTKDESWADLIEAGQATPVSCKVPEYSLTIKTKNANGKTVAGWIDWNGNESFDAGERTDAVAAGDKVTLVWDKPAAPRGSTVGARFRVASNAGDLDLATGLAGDGEVEDHLLAVQPCGLSLAKSASPTTVDAANRTITYTFTVKNTGQVPLSNVVINDSLISATPLPVADTLAAGASKTITKSYSIDQDRVEQGGTLVNEATASGDYGGNSSGATDDAAVTSAVATATVQVDNTSALKVTKALDQNTAPKVGDVLTYTIAVTNAGQSRLNGVKVDDPMLAGGRAHLRDDPSQFSINLAPGAQAIFAGSYTVTQADLDGTANIKNGVLKNTATASGATAGGTPTSSQASAETPFEPAPKMSLSKSGPARVSGDTITYDFTLQNTGDVSLTHATFSDPLLGITDEVVFPTGTQTKLAPGEFVQFQKSYSLTLADREAAQVKNTATGQGSPITGGTVTATSGTVTTKLTSEAGFELAKAGTVTHTAHPGAAASVDAAGDTIDYTFTLTNPGQLTLKDLSYTDALLGKQDAAVTVTIAGGPRDGQSVTDLRPGEKGTFTASYTVTQEDVDTRSTIDNQASATGTPVTADTDVAKPSADSNTVKIPVLGSKSFSVAKALGEGESSDAKRKLGDTITYVITVKNTGTASLNGLSYSDPLTGAKDVPVPNQPLAPGATRSIGVSYTVTQKDVDAGSVANTATASLASGDPVSSNTVRVPTVNDAALSLSKQGTLSASGPGGAAKAGDTITYALTVKNTGSVSITDPVVTDAKLGLNGAVCVPAGGDAAAQQQTLAPGATCVVTAAYTLTQADVDARTVHNSASAQGKDPRGEAVGPAEAQADVATVGSTGLQLFKGGAPLDNAKAGDKVSYTFTVINTGTVTVKNAVVTDPKLGGTFAVSPSTLAPGATGTATAPSSYALTQADVDAGWVSNSASVTGTVPAGYPVPTTSAATITPIAGLPALELGKKADKESVVKVGEVITYTVTAHNTGAVTLKNVVLTDPMLVSAENPNGTLPDSGFTLAPGASQSVSFTHTVTQDEIDAKVVTNTAAFTAQSANPNQPQPVTGSSPQVNVPAKGAPGLSITKARTDTSEPKQAGDKVTFELTVTNTGDTTLNDVAASDTPAGVDSVALGKSTLKPGESTTGTVEYAVTQADLDAGSFTNRARAQASSKNGAPVPDATSNDVVVPFPASPAWSVEKTSNQEELSQLGDTVSYDLTVSNTGNVTLKNVQLADANAQIESPEAFELAPGESRTFTAKHTVTQADLDAGRVDNIATATAQPVRGANPGPQSSDQVTDPVKGSVDFTVEKVVSTPEALSRAGEKATFEVRVKNTGTTTLREVLVTDPLVGVSLKQLDLPEGLAPGATATLSVEYTLTQSDVDAGSVLNTATASVIPPAAYEPPAPKDAQAKQEISGESSYTLSKQDAPTPNPLTGAGDKVKYTLTIKNTGTTTLSHPRITDAKLGLTDAVPTAEDEEGVAQPVSELAPGQSAQLVGTWTVTQAEADAGAVKNTATAAASVPPFYEEHAPEPPTASTNTPIERSPSLSLSKAGAVVDAAQATQAGQKIRYTLTVKNTGNTTLYRASVSDPLAGQTPLSVSPSTLAPGASGVASFDHTITQAEADAGVVPNTASATAVPPAADGSAPPAEAAGLDPVTASKNVPVDAKPAVKITKSAAPEPGKSLTNARAGDRVLYTITVSNTGQVTLSDLRVSDALVGLDAEAVGTLAPGASTQLTRSYTLKQSDLDAGSRKNVASVVGTPPRGEAVKDSTTVTTPVTGASSFTLEKSSEVKTASGRLEKAGDKVEYTLTVRNTGATTLSNIAVKDPMSPTELVASPSSIAPGKTATATFVHAVTQQELDKGLVRNQASASATPPYGDPLKEQPSNTVEIPTDGRGALSVLKGLRGSASKAGDTVTYTFKVINTGALTISDVTVADPKVSKTPIAVVPSTLKPGQEGLAEVVYTLTQADVNAGGFDNRATASGKDPQSKPVKSPDSNIVTVDVLRSPSISVAKRAVLEAGQVLTKAGDKIKYELRVTNTGNVTLEGATVSDAKLGVKDAPVAPSTLNPGESGTAVFSYTLTQADADAQQVRNSGTGAAHPSYDPDAKITPESPATVVTPVRSTASLVLKKSVTPPAEGSVSAAGDEVEYTFEIINTGTRTLADVTLNDPLLGGSLKLKETKLAPGESTTLKRTYVLKQTDVDRGTVNNTAVATGTPVGDAAALPQVSDSARLGLNGEVAMDLSKEPISTAVPTKAGDVIRYAVIATNTGTLSLTGVVIEDAGSNEKSVDVDGTLAPGASARVEFTHTVTQDEVNAGTFANTATVSGTGPKQGDEDPKTVTDHPSNTVTTPIAGQSALRVEKSQDEDVVLSKAGEALRYTVKVINTGTTTLVDPEIADPLAPINPFKLTKTTLQPGESDVYSFEYTLTQADVDAGSVSNTATATATPPSGYPALERVPSNTVTKTIAGSPSFSVEKSSAHGELRRAGDGVLYSIKVSNTGTTVLHDPRFDDPMLGLANEALGVDSLAPGAFAVKEIAYTLTQADVDAGVVRNAAAARVVPPASYPQLPTQSSNEVVDPIGATSDFEVAKAAKALSEGALSAAGDQVEYTLTLKNTGDTTLRNATVSDAKLGLKDAAVEPSTLAPGESGQLIKRYTLTQADVDKREVLNVASGVATPPAAFDPVGPKDSNEVRTPVTPVDSLRVEKGFEPMEAGRPARAGDVVRFWVKVSNDGTSTLNQVSVSDPLAAQEPKPAGKDGTLAPGASDTVVFPYTLTQADVDRGSVENIATASYTPAGTDTPAERDSNPVTVGLNGVPALSVFKERVGEGFPARAGDTIDYNITVSNTGTLTVSDVQVSDPGADEALVAVDGPLAPGKSATIRVQHTLTQAEVDAGSFENTASATGLPPAGSGGGTPSRLDPAPSNTVSTPVLATSLFTVVKKADASDLTAAGQDIVYTLTLTNTGTTTLHDATVSDPMYGPDPVPLGKGPLAPGQSATFEFTHAVTQAEADAGTVVNTATGAARSPGDGPVLETVTSNTTRTPVGASSDLLVHKRAKIFGEGTAKQRVEYTVKVTNTGATTLGPVTVTDPMVGAQRVDVSPAVLAPGESGEAHFTYHVTDADLSVGTLVNVATASALGQNGIIVGGVSSNRVESHVKPPVAPPNPEPQGPGPQRPGPLPGTGAAVLGVAGGAVLLVLLGGFLVIRRRKE